MPEKKKIGHRPKGIPKGNAGRKKGTPNKPKDSKYLKLKKNRNLNIKGKNKHVSEVRNRKDVLTLAGVETDIPEFLFENVFDVKKFNDEGLSPKEKLIACNILLSSLGNLTIASSQMGFSRATFKSLLSLDPYFSECVNEVTEIILDFTERNLMKLINMGDRHAIIFLLKTLGKHRGYVERIESINATIEPITVNISQTALDTIDVKTLDNIPIKELQEKVKQIK